MIQMTFKRYETKYLLSPIIAHKLQRALPGHLQMDEYGLDTICSLYYDTPDDQLIRRSLEKPVYKEKLRLRSYGRAYQLKNQKTEEELSHPLVFENINKNLGGICYA